MLVVVSGLPGAGKTSLAHALASALEVPVVSKDAVKEALFDALGIGDAAYALLGPVTYDVLYATLAAVDDAVVDGAFHASRAPARLTALGKPLCVVHCACPVSVARSRYESRTRHAAHLDAFATDAEWALWSDEMGSPLPLEAPVLQVDCTGRVDAPRVAAWVRALAH